MVVFADACRQRNSHVFTTLSSGADGHVSGTVDYDIFGEPVTETGVFVGSAGGMTNLVFGYAGKPYDPVTGLSDYGFRDYAPSLARFTTVDPIRDGSNWYAYCNADPVNYVDAWGLYTQCEVNDVRKYLEVCASVHTPLSDFIDTEKFASLICANLDKLDPKTRDYYLNIPEQYRRSAILSDLNNTMVYSGIYGNTASSILSNMGSNIILGGNEDNSVDGFTIGHSIFFADALFPSNISDEDIELLGHESIHTLQSTAHGTAAFMTIYNTQQYDASNPYEVAAYWFGGKLFGDFEDIIENPTTGTQQLLGTGQDQTDIRR